MESITQPRKKSNEEKIYPSKYPIPLTHKIYPFMAILCRYLRTLNIYFLYCLEKPLFFSVILQEKIVNLYCVCNNEAHTKNFIFIYL